MTCGQVHRRLPGYVDGAIHSRDHARVREHLDSCADCREELNRYHRLSASLARMERTAPPDDLIARIRVRVSQERAYSRAWRLGGRAWLIFENILRPLAVPATGGLVTAVLVFILVVQSLLVGIPLGAVPNDLPTSLLQPARLESLAPFPVPGIGTAGEHNADAGLLMLEATLDAQGDVVHYDILSGPDTAAVRRQFDQVLLFSRFRPQLSFGRPTAGGRVLLIFSEVRVTG